MSPMFKQFFVLALLVSVAFCQVKPPRKEDLTASNTLPKVPIPTGVTSGLVIMCERYNGQADATVITGNAGSYMTWTGSCQRQWIDGINAGGRARDHAKLWPAFGSTFKELGELEEGQIVCNGGGRAVGVVEYTGGNWQAHYCDTDSEAHFYNFNIS